MRAGKKIVVLLLGFIMMLGLVNVPAHAAEDTFGQNLVKSYGIPDEVIQVIIDNSRLATGETLAEKQITPDTLTLNDIENLQIFRVSNEQTAADGGDASLINVTVANWVATTLNDAWAQWKIAANSEVIPDNVLETSEVGFRYDYNMTQLSGLGMVPERLLASDFSDFKVPVINALLAIASLTGKNLLALNIPTTIDLKGLLSGVTIPQENVPFLTSKILTMLSIQQLTNLTTLILDNNRIGIDLNRSDGAAAFNLGKGPFNVPSLRTLSLKNNGIQIVNDNLLTYAAEYIDNLDLANNDIKTIGWNNGKYFGLILDEIKDATNINISGNGEIDFTDSTVLKILLGAVNAKGQNVTMDDVTANELIIAGMSKYDNTLSTKGLMTIIDQMDEKTLTKIIAGISAGGNANPDLLADEVIEYLFNQADEDNLILKLRDDGSPEAQKALDDLRNLLGDGSDSDGPPTEQQKKLDELLNKVITPPDTAENKLELIGSALDFGQLNIAALQSDDFSVATTSPTTLKGTLLAGVTLSVSATVWQDDTDPAKVKTLKPTITFTLDGGSAALPIILDSTGQATQTILKNDTTTAQNFSYSVSDNGKFSLSKMGKDVQAGTYKGKITWEITNGVSDTAD